MKGDAAMADLFYRSVDGEHAKANDEKLAAAELHLLTKILTANSEQARNFAEAYALLRGSVTSTAGGSSK
jgi:hypothetical protein